MVEQSDLAETPRVNPTRRRSGGDRGARRDVAATLILQIVVFDCLQSVPRELPHLDIEFARLERDFGLCLGFSS